MAEIKNNAKNEEFEELINDKGISKVYDLLMATSEDFREFVEQNKNKAL